jgi:hypothetical protein
MLRPISEEPMRFTLLASAILLLFTVGCEEDSVRPHIRPPDLAGTGPIPTFDLAEIPLPDGSAFTDDAGPTFTGDPQTCSDAAAAKSYIGCDYWPTVVVNNVSSDFDYAVVVANTGSTTANITITGPNSTNQTGTVAANSLTKFYLPWVMSLKGQDAICGASFGSLSRSVKAVKSAYHLVADRPVTVYQFSALEYKGVGGPPGKDWSTCQNGLCGIGCFSFSNDATLLLPSTAMTGNYRVAGHQTGLAATVTITATQDNTTVKMKLSSTAEVEAGSGSSGITKVTAGNTGMWTLNTGDALELLGGANSTSDLSGSLVQADKPVQVIAADGCINNPAGADACDHIEQSMFPIETLGKDYVVSVPTAPAGDVRGHTVRIYGNVDNTMLTFNPPLSGVKTTINAGEVIDVGQTSTDFEVKGDHEFAVASFQLGGSIVDPTSPASMRRGDPSQSMMVAVAQWRTKYVFLAPSDYDVSYVDIVAPMGANIMLDGANVTLTPKVVGTTTYGVIRQKLGPGTAGAHVMTSDQPVGIQVMGYGAYTSYQYPGGLDLQMIAPPPPPIS